MADLGRLRWLVAGTVAILLHGMGAMLIFAAPERSGAAGAGRGGIAISLGDTGATDGASAPEVKPDQSPPADMRQEVLAQQVPDNALVTRSETPATAPPQTAAEQKAFPAEPAAIAIPPRTAQPLQYPEKVRADHAISEPPLALASSPRGQVAKATLQQPLREETEADARLTRQTGPREARPVKRTNTAQLKKAQPSNSASSASHEPDVIHPIDTENVKVDAPVPTKPRYTESATDRLVVASAETPEDEVAAPQPRQKPPEPERKPIEKRKEAAKSVEPSKAPQTQTAAARAAPSDREHSSNDSQGSSNASEDQNEATASGAGANPGTRAGGGANSAGAGTSGAQADYIARLQSWLARHQRYPNRARSRRQQGTALLYFVMDSRGLVLDYRVERSSGHRLLDQEVRALIKRAEPLPKMPVEWQQSRLELVVPIQFILR